MSHLDDDIIKDFMENAEDFELITLEDAEEDVVYSTSSIDEETSSEEESETSQKRSIHSEESETSQKLSINSEEFSQEEKDYEFLSKSHMRKLRKQERMALRTEKRDRKKKQMEQGRSLEDAVDRQDTKMILNYLIDVNTKIHDFLTETDFESLTLAPMPADLRRVVKVLARNYELKHKIRGNRKMKMTILIRTNKTIVPDSYKSLPYRMIPLFKGKAVKKTASPKSSSSKDAGPQIGRKVGEKAPPVSQDNVGHKMLISMGWKPGETLGTEDNKGLEAPIDVTIRPKRRGLGA
jgi:hypothetical protein